MAPALRLFITLSLLVLLLPGAAAPVQAAPALVSLDGSGRLNLTSRLQLVRAEGRDLQTILALDDSVWRRLDHPLSQAKGRYWARVAVQNATDMPLEQLIVSDFPATNSIALWQVDAAGNTRQLAAPAGINFPFLHRDERHRRVLATLQLAPGEQALLVWQIESRPLFRFAARVWPPEQFQPADHNRSLLYGMLYGALLIMAVYNLFLWIALREKHYFFYVIYLLCAGYLAGAEEGHLYQFLWPASAWPKALVLTLVSAASIGAFFVFSSAFLRLRRRQQTLFRFLRVVALLTIGATLIGGILEQAWAARTALALAIPFYLLALLAAVRVRMRGFIPAGYYVAAMLLLVIAMVLNNLVALGVWSGISGLEDFNAIATAVMMAFFSIALASKIDQLQRDSDNAAAGIASANREIHRINNELVQARMERAALEQSAIGARRESQAKSAFLATIGHEIRTPMSGVLGMAELLKGTELNTSQLHYVNIIERSGHSLLEVISDLLDYAIIESGAMELHIEPFDLFALIDDNTAIFTLRAVEKRINLFAEIAPDVDRQVRGDPRKLQQVLLNLLSNAFKYTDSGEVVVRVSRSARTAVNSVELRFEVIDTGIGMNDEIKAKLFEPFAAEDAPISGKGLGLAIVNQLVRLMDGEVGVESAPGQGARFWFTARFLVVPDQAPAPRPLQGRRVLLISAPGLVTTALQNTLTGWGAVVRPAHSAEAAVSAAANARFDIVVVDDHRDAGLGLPLLGELHAAHPGLAPAILLTGANRPQISAGLTTAGVAQVLEKPVARGALLQTLQRVLGQAPDAALPKPAALRNFASLKVLVVEDNPVNQLVIRELLAQLGVIPALTENGLQALDRIHAEPFDVVLMDCEMPELDGYEATRQLRAFEQRSERPGCRVVGVSAHAGSDYRERALHAGMDSYLTKPLSLSDLAHELHAADHARQARPH